MKLQDVQTGGGSVGCQWGYLRLLKPTPSFGRGTGQERMRHRTLSRVARAMVKLVRSRTEEHTYGHAKG
jgi:hypothetical protein